MPKVQIYTTSTCAYCRAEKKFLNEHQIPYEDIAVDEDQAAIEAMIEKSGQLGVPFTVITQDDQTEIHILGFDQARLAQALGL